MDQAKLQLQLIRSYLDSTQLMMQCAHYKKLEPNWKATHMMTDINRLYFIREGDGWIQIRGKDYYPEPGRMYLIPAGMKLSYAMNEENPICKYWCHFSATVGDVNLFQMLEQPYWIQVQDEAGMEQRFEQLIELNRSNTVTAPFRIKSILLEILSEYIEQCSEQVELAADTNSSKINSVLAYIEGHLSEQMTVDELAKLVHFHPNYFLHYFKSKMGLSPIMYINKKRLDKARRLLRTTEQSISVIAEDIGMEPYYFSRIFKRQNGMSPSEYRKASGSIYVHKED